MSKIKVNRDSDGNIIHLSILDRYKTSVTRFKNLISYQLPFNHWLRIEVDDNHETSLYEDSKGNFWTKEISEECPYEFIDKPLTLTLQTLQLELDIQIDEINKCINRFMDDETLKRPIKSDMISLIRTFKDSLLNEKEFIMDRLSKNNKNNDAPALVFNVNIDEYRWVNPPILDGEGDILEYDVDSGECDVDSGDDNILNGFGEYDVD